MKKNFGVMVATAITGLSLSGYAFASGAGHCETTSCKAAIDKCSAKHDCKGHKACGKECTKDMCEKGGGKWVEKK